MMLIREGVASGDTVQSTQSPPTYMQAGARWCQGGLVVTQNGPDEHPVLLSPPTSVDLLLTACEAPCHLGAWPGWQTVNSARKLLPPSRQPDPGP